MSATLTDVARRAGVSLATASRAFGDPSRLATATREKVIRAALDLEYAAPQAAQATRTLGVVVPDVSNPVYGALIRSINAQAWHGRHRVMLFNTDENPHREREQIEEGGQLDGLLLCSPRLTEDEIINHAGDRPLVVVNREISGAPSVMMDTDHGLRQTVEHLGALGHHHIAYAAGPLHSWADGRRADTITALSEEFGLELTRLTHHAASILGGRAAAATAMASKATAVIAYNDLVALGVQAGIADLGLRCPDDISIVGIDDIEIGAAVQPPLTTVHLAIERAGALAVDLLLEKIAGSSEPTTYRLDSQLIVRGSTGRPKSRA
ncbi:LacI family DNA-binding transcriptional regulator [Microbacterium pumilum]|uniref:LacI family DNA-binding transcriptional regulator n=1 Tax=Microbacterium pumilum TaxID=344165 RepID=A0ABP5DKA5_9MICO